MSISVIYCTNSNIQTSIDTFSQLNKYSLNWYIIIDPNFIVIAKFRNSRTYKTITIQKSYIFTEFFPKLHLSIRYVCIYTVHISMCYLGRDLIVTISSCCQFQSILAVHALFKHKVSIWLTWQTNSLGFEIETKKADVFFINK